MILSSPLGRFQVGVPGGDAASRRAFRPHLFNAPDLLSQAFSGSLRDSATGPRRGVAESPALLGAPGEGAQFGRGGGPTQGRGRSPPNTLLQDLGCRAGVALDKILLARIEISFRPGP